MHTEVENVHALLPSSNIRQVLKPLVDKAWASSMSLDPSLSAAQSNYVLDIPGQVNNFCIIYESNNSQFCIESFCMFTVQHASVDGDVLLFPFICFLI